jgi:thiol-disulfide isomerase/thioredoxin
MKPLLLSILGAAMLSAQDDATQLLKKVSQTYRDLNAYSFESEYQGGLTSEWQGSWSKGRTILEAASGNRARFDMIDHAAAYTVVSDGKTVWIANGYAREYWTSPVSGALFDTKGGGQEAQTALRRLRGVEEQHWNLDRDLMHAAITGNETLEIDGTRIACTIVRAEYSPPAGARFEASTTRTFWIDSKRNLILRVDFLSRGNLFPDKPFVQVENRSTLRYTHISIDAPPSKARFAWTPPDNFRQVDTLESPMAHTAAKEMIGKPAPELTGATLDGKPMALSSLRGSPVLLDFWATWCVPCRAQMPQIARLYRETKAKGLAVLGVNDDESPQTAIKWSKEYQYDWPSLFEGSARFAREKYKVDGIPTVVLIDRRGIIVEYQVGSGQETDKAIRSALRQQGIKVE